MVQCHMTLYCIYFVLHLFFTFENILKQQLKIDKYLRNFTNKTNTIFNETLLSERWVVFVVKGTRAKKQEIQCNKT